jgi:hypothetical protein
VGGRKGARTRAAAPAHPTRPYPGRGGGRQDETRILISFVFKTLQIGHGMERMFAPSVSVVILSESGA